MICANLFIKETVLKTTLKKQLLGENMSTLWQPCLMGVLRTSFRKLRGTKDEHRDIEQPKHRVMWRCIFNLRFY